MSSCLLPPPVRVLAGVNRAFRRILIGLFSIVVLGSASAQTPVAHSSTARIVDPVELSGPPKKLPAITPTKRAFGNSQVLTQLNSKDPKTLAGVVRDVTSFIQKDPTDPDFYFLRASVSCLVNSDKNAILNDVVMSIKLFAPKKTYVYDSLRDHYALKAKAEFSLGRYQDAMTDLDASIQVDYSSAEQVFNDGNVKPNQPTATPCAWTQTDLNTLARLFPNDYRPSLYLGLYLLQFTHYSLDADYQPIMKAFGHAAELNPSSAQPLYFTAKPYIIGGIGGLLSKASAKCLDDVVPRTKDCLALDDIHRTAVRFLTRAIATDATFVPSYELRATTLFQLRESRQAIRDYNKTLELNPKANIYNDRALAEMDLHEYQAAILDFTKAIAHGCDTS